MHNMDAKDEAKKEGLMELIKKMYAMMDQEEKSGEENEEEGEEGEMSMMEDKKDGGLMAKAMEKSVADATDLGDDLDMAEVKEFLTKKRKMPVGKSINFMAVTKTPVKKFDVPKAMKKYA